MVLKSNTGGVIGDVLVEIFHQIPVAVDVQRLEIAHDLAKESMPGEKFGDSRPAQVLGQAIAFHAMEQEFPLAAHQYASSLPVTRRAKSIA